MRVVTDKAKISTYATQLAERAPDSAARGADRIMAGAASVDGIASGTDTPNIAGAGGAGGTAAEAGGVGGTAKDADVRTTGGHGGAGGTAALAGGVGGAAEGPDDRTTGASRGAGGNAEEAEGTDGAAEVSQDPKSIELRFMNELTVLANQVADEFEAAVYVYSGRIDRIGLGSLIESMGIQDSRQRRRNSLLILTTYGGGADSAYKIARSFQRASEKFYLCVPYLCKSAGTLIALGANEILMEESAEFGPLDVQLPRRNELAQRRSGMAVRTALDELSDETYKFWSKAMLKITVKTGSLISFEMAGKIAADMAVGVMSPIYSQISPEELGNDMRDLYVATQYGVRLEENGKNTNKGTVRKLVEGYPKHGFVIDQSEARKLFRTVNHLSENIENLWKKLFEVNDHIEMIDHKMLLGLDGHFIHRLDNPREGNTDEQDENQDTSRGEDSLLAETREGDRKSDQGRSREG